MRRLSIGIMSKRGKNVTSGVATPVEKLSLLQGGQRVPSVNPHYVRPHVSV